MKKVIVSVAAFSSSYNQASGKMFAVNEVLTNLKSLKPSFNGCTNRYSCTSYYSIFIEIKSAAVILWNEIPWRKSLEKTPMLFTFHLYY